MRHREAYYLPKDYTFPMHASEIFYEFRYQTWYILLKWFLTTGWFVLFQIPYSVVIEFMIQKKWETMGEMIVDGIMYQNFLNY